jgi:hypothetical protein
MFARGRRLFSSASLAMIAVAGLHTLGSSNTTPGSPAEAAVQQSMRGYQLPLSMMGLTPSLWDLFRDLAFTMSVTVTVLGLLGLVLAAHADVPTPVIRRVAWLMTLTSAALAGLSGSYHVAPPFISFVVVTILYLAAAVAG